MGRQFTEGLHQALEAKEHVEIKKETTTLATITFQNYFRMYKKLSGMTGTAKTEEEEFINIYNMRVIEIPTNRPVVRIDANDKLFATAEAKFNALIKDIKERHKNGQPILVGTIAVETSELVSKMLVKEHIPHKVLNAKQHEKEAEIILNAGIREIPPRNMVNQCYVAPGKFDVQELVFEKFYDTGSTSTSITLGAVRILNSYDYSVGTTEDVLNSAVKLYSIDIPLE